MAHGQNTNLLAQRRGIVRAKGPAAFAQRRTSRLLHCVGVEPGHSGVEDGLLRFVDAGPVVVDNVRGIRFGPIGAGT